MLSPRDSSLSDGGKWLRDQGLSLGDLESDVSFVVGNQFHSSSPVRPRSACVSELCDPNPRPVSSCSVLHCDGLNELVVFVAAETGYPLEQAHTEEGEPLEPRRQGVWAPAPVLKRKPSLRKTAPIVFDSHPGPRPAARVRRKCTTRRNRALPRQQREMRGLCVVPIPKCSSSTINGRPMSPKRRLAQRPQSACATHSREVPAAKTLQHTGLTTVTTTTQPIRPQSAPAHRHRGKAPLSGQPMQRERPQSAWGNHVGKKLALDVGIVALGCEGEIRGDQLSRSDLRPVHSPAFVGRPPKIDQRCRSKKPAHVDRAWEAFDT